MIPTGRLGPKVLSITGFQQHYAPLDAQQNAGTPHKNSMEAKEGGNSEPQYGHELSNELAGVLRRLVCVRTQYRKAVHDCRRFS